MARKAFTLIELLVVIAIIAILAAILFPVFAHAKTAAKKTVTLANMKQVALGMQLYAIDNDDVWPRQDGCQLNSSLNPALRTPTLNDEANEGCSGPFYNRMNHFSWQKWTQMYVKNVDIFKNPLREMDPDQWNENGQMTNQFVLNQGFTGALDINIFTGAPQPSRGRRNSWIGGNQTALPSPSQAALFFELTSYLPFVPIATDDTQRNGTDIVGYPMAYREYYTYKLYKGAAVDCWLRTPTSTPDDKKAIQGGITVGYADGSAKFLKAGAFLARTPTKAELGISGTGATSGYTFQNDCHGMDPFPSGAIGIRPININVDYPMWGFSR